MKDGRRNYSEGALSLSVKKSHIGFRVKWVCDKKPAREAGFLSPLQLLTIGIFFCASALKKFRYGDHTTIEIRTMIVNAIAS